MSSDAFRKQEPLIHLQFDSIRRLCNFLYGNFICFVPLTPVADTFTKLGTNIGLHQTSSENKNDTFPNMFDGRIPFINFVWKSCVLYNIKVKWLTYHIISPNSCHVNVNSLIGFGIQTCFPKQCCN